MSSPATTPGAPSVGLPDLARFTFSAEFQLLLACCSLRTTKDADVRSRIEASVDWGQVLRLAEHHNVMPLVYQSLREVSEAVPAGILNEVHARYQNNARKNLRFTAELFRILDCLESHRIPAIPFKGPVLAETVYGNLALREFSDLDILVRRRDFLRAKVAVRELGFTPAWRLSNAEESAYLTSGYECAFDGPAGRNLLELQWGIVPAFYAVDFDLEEFFERASRCDFGNRSVVALSPEDLLLSLGVHTSKHAWIRLCWLRDVAGVAQSTALNWACVWQEARRLGIERILTINLRLANMLLGAGACQSEQQRDHPETIAISDRIAADMPSAEEYSTESLEYFRLMLRLRERRSDRVRFALRLLFTPSVGEWSVVRLPGPLFPLYRLIRLFRVAARFLRMGGARNHLHETSSE